LLSGRELARTRANLFETMRLFDSRERAVRAPHYGPAASSQTQYQQETALQAALGRERRP